MKLSMEKSIRTLSIGLIIISFFSCSSHSESNITRQSFTWLQTKCSDPWGTSSTDSNDKTSRKIISYLEEKGIKNPIVLSFTNSSSTDLNTCDACVCKSGIIITVETDKSQTEAMTSLGFN